MAETAEQFEYGAGDLFPVGAALAGRSVTTTCVANEDSRVMHMLDVSRQAMQVHWSSQALAEQCLERSLSQLPPKQVLVCQASAPPRKPLLAMHERRAGSVLVLDAAAAPQGILTRHDILDRLTLMGLSLDTPVPAGEAGRPGGQHRVRAPPVRAAAFVPEATGRIRGLARSLLAQGVHECQLTELIGHLNDLLTARLVHWVVEERGLDLRLACWLAFGSEGRSEQTVATDQDNGLIFDSTQPDQDRPAWLAMATEVNEALDDSGYPLCKGGVMASKPDCCPIAVRRLPSGNSGSQVGWRTARRKTC